MDFISDPIKKSCTSKHYASEQSYSLVPDGFFQQPRRVAVATSLFKIHCASETLLNTVWKKELLRPQECFFFEMQSGQTPSWISNLMCTACSAALVSAMLPVKAWEFVDIPGPTSSTASQHHQGETGCHTLCKLKHLQTVPADSGYSLLLLQKVNLRSITGLFLR